MCRIGAAVPHAIGGEATRNPAFPPSAQSHTQPLRSKGHAWRAPSIGRAPSARGAATHQARQPLIQQPQQGRQPAAARQHLARLRAALWVGGAVWVAVSRGTAGEGKGAVRGVSMHAVVTLPRVLPSVRCSCLALPGPLPCVQTRPCTRTATPTTQKSQQPCCHAPTPPTRSHAHQPLTPNLPPASLQPLTCSSRAVRRACSTSTPSADSSLGPLAAAAAVAGPAAASSSASPRAASAMAPVACMGVPRRLGLRA